MTKSDYKALSQGISRDMSSQAIARRLRILAELYELTQRLSKARRPEPHVDADRHAHETMPLED